MEELLIRKRRKTPVFRHRECQKASTHKKEG